MSELSLNQRFPPAPQAYQVQSTHQSTDNQQSNSQDSQDQQSENLFAEVALLFDNESEIPVSGGNNQLVCQSLDELMIMQKLSQLAPPIPTFHGPKLMALTSSIDQYKD